MLFGVCSAQRMYFFGAFNEQFYWKCLSENIKCPYQNITSSLVADLNNDWVHKSRVTCYTIALHECVIYRKITVLYEVQIKTLRIHIATCNCRQCGWCVCVCTYFIGKINCIRIRNVKTISSAVLSRDRNSVTILEIVAIARRRYHRCSATIQYKSQSAENLDIWYIDPWNFHSSTLLNANYVCFFLLKCKCVQINNDLTIV